MRFWCLQTLADACRVHLPVLDPNDAAALRAAVASWVHEACVRTHPPVPPFIKNKLAQVTALLVGKLEKTKRGGREGKRECFPSPIYSLSRRSSEVLKTRGVAAAVGSTRRTSFCTYEYFTRST